MTNPTTSPASWSDRLLREPRHCVHWVRIAGCVLLGALGVLGVSAGVMFANGRDGDFFHFYEAARAAAQGADLYESGKRGYIYPPLFALLLRPLAGLSMEAAGVVWTFLNTLMVGAALLLLAREALVRLGRTPGSVGAMRWAALLLLTAGLGVLPIFDKVGAVLKLGQSDGLTLLLISGALVLQRSRPVAAGILLGLAFNIKYQAIVFLPYLLVRRRFGEALGMAGSATAGLLSGALVFGWERNVNYLGRAFAGLLEMAGLRPQSSDAADIHSITWERSVSLVSASARLAERLGLPLLTPVGVLAAGLAALMVGWWMLARFDVSGRGLWRGLLAGRGGRAETTRLAWVSMLEWAGLLTAVLVFSPQTTNRHMFLLTFATVLAACVLWCTTHARSRAVLLAGLGVMLAGLTLPPGGKQFAEALTQWRAVGGASWCVLVMYFTLLWAGLTLWKRVQQQPASGAER